MSVHAPTRMGKIPPHALAPIRLAGKDWQRFIESYEAITADGDDATVEDFAGFYEIFMRLRRLAVPFDPRFVAAVERINASNRFSDDDSDADDSDQWIDREDSDEDAHGEI